MQRSALVFTLSCLLTAAVLVPDTSAQVSLTDELDEAVAEFHGANPTAPGISVYAVCPALDLDWSAAVGTVARDGTEPLTPAHTFRIASNTKTYTATAVLRLVELDRLGLDDPLGAHLTAADHGLLAGDGYDLVAITLRQVLSHTAGFDEHSGDPRYAEAILANPQRRWTRAEQIRKCVEWRDPVGEPGEHYRYSDTGYVILGGVIERTTGKNLGVAVHELIDYEALGLVATWWEELEAVPAGAGPRAHQYYGEHDATGWNPSLDLYGGGGIVTDARELAWFLRKLLKGEVLGREETLAAMTGDGTPSYRLGLMVVDLAGNLAWGHQGFWNTFAFHVPALDLTVAGSILDHHATNGRELAGALVARVAAAVDH